MLTTDQTGERLGDIMVQMVKAKGILKEINEDYDIIRSDRYDRDIRELYSSDSNLQDSLMSLRDAIMYIKHEISMLDCDKDE